jgi:LysM repeat protein
MAVLIAVSVLTAAFPRPAQAATCAERYTVREGDTKSSISRRFDMDWDDIADASDIDPSDRIRPGQRLCIPEVDDDERPNASVRLRASATHRLLTLNISGLTQKKAVFITRVRDPRVGVGGFTKLGNVKVKKGDTATKSFTIPSELLNALYLQVCIKNASTDEMRCQTVIHP